MRKFLNQLVTFILIGLGKISSKLSIRGRNRLGKLLGDILRNADRKRCIITRDNLKAAFPGESNQWIEQIVIGSYRNLGITLAELLAFESLSENDFYHYIKYENIELIHNAYNRGRGVLLMSGHFGNWELIAYTAGLFTKIPILIVVKPQSNELADEFLNKYRTQGGNSVISMYNAAIRMVKTLRSGGIIALLADQSATMDKDIFVDFFGRAAATFEAPADLALRLNIPIIMGFAVRQEDCTYKVKLTEIFHDDLEFNKEGIIELTRRHVKALEDAISEHPDHWAWQHRRWKHQPPV